MQELVLINTRIVQVLLVITYITTVFWINPLLLSCAAMFMLCYVNAHLCIEVELVQLFTVPREIVAEIEAFVKQQAHDKLLIIDYRSVQKFVP